MFWRGWPNFWIFPSADIWEVQPYNRLVVARSCARSEAICDGNKRSEDGGKKSKSRWLVLAQRLKPL